MRFEKNGPGANGGIWWGARGEHRGGTGPGASRGDAQGRDPPPAINGPRRGNCHGLGGRGAGRARASGPELYSHGMPFRGCKHWLCWKQPEQMHPNAPSRRTPHRPHQECSIRTCHHTLFFVKIITQHHWQHPSQSIHDASMMHMDHVSITGQVGSNQRDNDSVTSRHVTSCLFHS